NRRLHRWPAGVSETPAKRNLNDLFEVELDFIGLQRIQKSIERLLQPGFRLFKDVYDFLKSCLVNETTRPVNKETNIFVKLDFWMQVHGSILPEDNFEVSRCSGTPSHCADSSRF